ncbi:hypothetical protein HRbin07_00379 [bacterium HR07]|uniref:Antitoxin n=1 Tax=Acetithermum autotrophicum TaxID=1446466 RepID=H5SU28_ACEAU|nr:hypothetical conserved protein [Candidatus Acetothermum autotrophicum]GBC76182.1 hypothetical protein HRbin07_00379 [bacterium HR07]
MGKSVGIREAIPQFTRLLKEVERGEEIIITRRGVPVALIVPFERAESVKRKLAYLRTVELSAKLQDLAVDAQTLVKEAREDLEAR